MFFGCFGGLASDFFQSLREKSYKIFKKILHSWRF